MLTSIVLSALFAVGLLAVPLNLNRALIEDIIVVTITDYVYADALPPTSTTSTTTTPAYTPPVAVPSTTSTTSIYTPPPPPASSSPAVPVVAVVTPAPAPNVLLASPASGAPTTLVPDLDVTSPTYTAIALQHHNVHRANHSANPLVYNQTLASWAQTKAESCVWDESL